MVYSYILDVVSRNPIPEVNRQTR